MWIFLLIVKILLLDEDLKPQVANFGFPIAIPIQHGSSCIVSSAGATALAGTRGYLGPEFATAKLTPKSDMYIQLWHGIY